MQPDPDDELQRIDALRSLRLLDSSPDPAYDRVVNLAARLLDVPIALITLVDVDRQWFKARVGLGLEETDRSVAFCAFAIGPGRLGPFVVEDASSDERFSNNPLVTGDPFIRSYAGVPLRTRDGHRVGTLCVIDRRPRQFSAADLHLLTDLAVLAEDLLQRAEDDASRNDLQRRAQRETLLRDTMQNGMVIQDLDGQIIDWNPAAERLLGLTGDELSGRSSFNPNWRSVHADGTPWHGATHPAMEAIRCGVPVHGATMGIHRPGDGLIWLGVNSTPIIDAAGVVTGAMTTFADITTSVNAASAVVEPPKPPVGATTGYDKEALIESLDQYATAIDAATAALATSRHAVEGLLIEIRNDGDLREYLSSSPAAGESTGLTDCITRLEESRRQSRLQTFRTLQEYGASIGEISRIWQISRQLASRILKEGRDAE